MPLEKYEDFFDLSIKDLTNYLAVRGLNTSGRKVELVARAFAAFELKMIIIASSEEQLSLGNIFAYILEKNVRQGTYWTLEGAKSIFILG